QMSLILLEHARKDGNEAFGRGNYNKIVSLYQSALGEEEESKKMEEREGDPRGRSGLRGDRGRHGCFTRPSVRSSDCFSRLCSSEGRGGASTPSPICRSEAGKGRAAKQSG
ncbi:hypothetical protein PMAYCL1PPCAC_25853, partial [Pristionchus mayeri]